ncbi:C40 family peptidase [Puerhibacterium puerhi]|uniref:C40 family peptidase n=1 Tax=Puerhibacterium puerhi TaxID=2692623 RepID=UPI00135AEA75|nr:C40 family peptidase [Puerhibacterium puerhi]
MSARTNSARHRAARRPVTPLTELAQTVGNGAGRRAAVVATAGGLLVSTFGGATAAQAAPAHSDAKLSTVDLSALTEQAREALSAAPVVTVAKDAQVSVETVTTEGAVAVEVTPAPEPEPEPEPVVRESAPSRSAERTSTSERTTSESTESASASESSSSSEESATEAAPEPAAASVPAAANGSTIISIASRYVGVPYVSGGTTPSGFDCSGFTQYVFAQAGISLPRTSGEQRYAGTVVSRSAAQPGDLIWSPGHIAIYAGDGMQIDAPRPGKTIQFRSIWQSNPTFIRVG